MGYETDLASSYHRIHERLVHKPEVKPLCIPEPFDHEPINIWVPSISYIIKLVALHEQVSIVDILSHRRNKRSTQPRMMIYYLAIKFTTHSTPTIGFHLGGRDHSTVICGAKRVAGRRLRNFNLDKRLRFYEKHLSERPKAS